MRFDRSVILGCATLPPADAARFHHGVAQALGVMPVCIEGDDKSFDGAVLLQVGPFIYNLEELTAMACEQRDLQKEIHK